MGDRITWGIKMDKKMLDALLHTFRNSTILTEEDLILLADHLEKDSGLKEALIPVCKILDKLNPILDGGLK